jgi:anti-anti-sigma factor
MSDVVLVPPHRPRSSERWVPVTSYLWIRRRDRADRVEVELAGELDRLSAHLAARMMDRGGFGRAVVLDLGRVTFVDLTGLGMLDALWTRIRAQGADLMIERTPPVVRRLQQVVGSVSGGRPRADAVSSASRSVRGPVGSGS